MWEHIHKLTGQKEKAKNTSDMYDTEGKKMGEKEGREGIIKTWNSIYKTGRFELSPIHSGHWVENEIAKLEEEYAINREKDRQEKGKIWEIGEKPSYTKEKLKIGLKRLKTGKSAGPDKIKAEIYKALGKRELCLKVIAESFNRILDDADIPISWKITKTRMIPKVEKPEPKDLRPIAVTNISYKLFMSDIGKAVEEHIEINNLTKGNQIGFTDGGRTEYNHFALQYLVDRAIRKKEQLIVIALDFKKAFDSIDRRKLIDILKEYMVNPHIVNLIAKIYSNDRTIVTIGDIEEEMDINSGIKQGCTASTTFFKLITYGIMNSIEEKGVEYEVEGQKISTLFFADDSLAMARTLEAAKKNLKIIIEASKKYGLHINKEKSNVLVYNNQEGITEIEGIKVVEKLKYLGLTIDNTGTTPAKKKDIFKSQKENIMYRADTASHRTYSVIKRSCNKMMIGKIYWKGVILPSVLHGIGLMEMNKREIGKLQAIENRAYGTILGARKGTPTATIRGETGASLVRTRFIKARIMLAHSIWNGKNELVKGILRNMRNDRGNTWNKQLNQYLEEINLSFDEMVEMSVEQIKKKILSYDSNKWYEDLITKRSLGIYRRFKKGIKDEGIYDNRPSSELLFRARSNTLALNIDNRHRRGNTECELCNVGEEDMVHFILECRYLENKRDQHLIRKYWNLDKEEMIGEMIFDNEETERVKGMLGAMWQKRWVKLKGIRGMRNNDV